MELKASILGHITQMGISCEMKIKLDIKHRAYVSHHSKEAGLGLKSQKNILENTNQTVSLLYGK